MGIAGYQVRDTLGGMVRVYSGSEAGKRAARRYAERTNNEYGVVRYIVCPMYVREGGPANAQ